MKYGTLLYTTASLLVISSSVYAGLEKETKAKCEELGYKTPAAECEKTGAIPLLCPFYDVTEANGTLSLCVTKSCRGYPLWKKGDTYYHFNTAGNVVPAVPAEGKVEDYVATFKECESGTGDEKRTYYRVETCKTTAINGVIPVYQSDICDVGCDRINKYPFDTHPGNLAGTVEECMDKDGTYYGYTKCNEGWDPDGHGRCNLSSCDIKVYPYTSDPNVEEYRGETETCKIGMNAYYKYTSCKNSTFQKKQGVCIKLCEIDINKCTSTSQEGGLYKDWSCPFKSNQNCRVGDLAAVNGKSIGVIVHLGTEGLNKKIIIPDANDFSFTRKAWASGASEVVAVAGLSILSAAAAKNNFEGKKNTHYIAKFAESKSWSLSAYYPAANLCLTYTPQNCKDSSSPQFCRQGEWYFPALGELSYLHNNRFILYNVFNNNTALYNGVFWSSSQSSALIGLTIQFVSGKLWGYGKEFTSNYAQPFLAF